MSHVCEVYAIHSFCSEKCELSSISTWFSRAEAPGNEAVYLDGIGLDHVTSTALRAIAKTPHG
jgi:hypothetical protein